MADKIQKPMSETTLQERKDAILSESLKEKRQREEEDEDDASGAGQTTVAGGAEMKETDTDKAELPEEASTGSKEPTPPTSANGSSSSKAEEPAVTLEAEESPKDAPAANEPADQDLSVTKDTAPATDKPKVGFGSASGFATASGFGSASGFASAPGSSSGFNFGADKSQSSATGFGSLLGQQSGSSTFGNLLDKQEESGDEQEEETADDEQYVAVRGLERTIVPTGEEGETCIHTVKAKLYAINPEAANEGWKERGLGTLRVLEADKEGKEKRGSRLVMRADAVLRVILNMPLRNTYKLEDGGEALGEKTLKLFGVEDGKGVWIAMRVGSKQAAEELKGVLRRCLDLGEREKSEQENSEIEVA
ncbi:hypothetical protein BCR37DRAFT_276900 [Protomyces lactucae-debilis]|uniref:RanBD1 domain-containing protein n=1 Tax=Protomyces lactucae-debilis TaxID=2754530 RepID=A0A1Y2FJE4_PROLT|nr:uncharacterized protein BCR37DRAFT_276900 [Protomyces lactucae-debilis]ORY83717.1 hypothetical protein BCR37DRAFT_276900 [Protomyces lactucae-debilis]